jgi:hypothetical protein
VTAGARGNHVESLLVSALDVSTGLWVNLGQLTNAGPNTLSLAVNLGLNPNAVYNRLRLVDNSPVVAGRDGWDIDAISVAAVPLPAAGLLLLAGLGGLAAFRRRSVAAAA